MTASARQADIAQLVRMVAPDSTVSEQLKAVHDLLRIPDRLSAKAAKVSATTIRRWRSEDTDDPSEGLENLRVVVAEIAETGQKSPRAIGSWLRSRNRALGFERPLDLVATADAETIGWIIEAGIAFANSYSLPEGSPQGTAIPAGSSDLGGRFGKTRQPIP